MDHLLGVASILILAVGAIVVVIRSTRNSRE